MELVLIAGISSWVAVVIREVRNDQPARKLARGRVRTQLHAPRSRVYCRCGCDRDVHRHWRRGTDCGSCGATGCRRFRRAPRHRATP